MRFPKVWLSIAGMVALAAALLLHEGAFSTRPWGAGYFPNVVLTDQHGQKVRLYEDLLKGKSIAVNTFFAGCGEVCPLGTAKMLELKKIFGDRVGREIFFYSISIDPFNDTPAALKAYADRFDVGAGWLFLTGDEKDIQVVTRKLGLGALQAMSSRDRHSTTLMVGHEPSGQWMKHSAMDNPQFLAASIETFLGWRHTQARKDYAEAAPLELTNGQFLFQNGCAACHTIGGGDKIGPDLLGIQERREGEWLRRMILVPNEVLDSGDLVANELLKRYGGVRMPNLGLSSEEVTDILGFIEKRSTLVRAGRHEHADQRQAAAR